MEIHFYEKPGCKNNTAQKQMLERFGHIVIAHNILETDWSQTPLYPFFEGIAVRNWFNMSAPRIKNAELQIDMMSEQMAIAAMVLDPILIKRPLLQVGAAYGCGFDSELATRLVQNKDVSALLSCSKPKGSSSCD